MRAMPSTADNRLTLSISLVLYHSSLELLSRTLRSLELALYHARESGRLAQASLQIVDNTGSIGYQSQLEKLLADLAIAQELLVVNYAQAKSNEGYGAGHNQALSQANSDIHLILNPDVELAETALSEGLATFAKLPQVSLVGAAATGEGGEAEYLCKRYPSILVLFLRALGWSWLQAPFKRRLHHYEMRELADATEETEVLLVSGCFMLVKTAHLKALSGFDERYFLYFEDFDLSLRLANFGSVVFNPALRIVHHGGYAARKGWQHRRLFIRSAGRFFNQYGWCWL
ncbi:glycosyltransferase [Parahaliea sp. F7430]|uniref:Glycosyltransferase n=1 Tax=Sediminihaliea albiluteola TaxID=2758564 RepID=A0A7W2YJ79_9GAMM|nr:glycosyltransferase [Sediminihaliea albiluteola]MBA6412822.1 glycosyltransferase [Sediminihaliea albiluteola]